MCPSCVYRAMRAANPLPPRTSTRPCASCGRVAKTAAYWACGPVCVSCYHRTLASKGTCRGCGQTRRIDPRLPAEIGLCSECGGLSPLSVCSGCGTEDRIFRRNRCYGCNLDDELARLLGDGEDLRPELGELRAALTRVGSPKAMLRWLAIPVTAATLSKLASGELDLTHEAIDGLGTTKAVAHLRQVLVAAGALPERSEVLARLESWIGSKLEQVRDDGDRRVVEMFAEWEVLRRRRTKQARRAVADTARDHSLILRAIEFLEWLGQHDRPLADAGQADVNLWLASGPPSRRDAHTFLRWAEQRRLCAHLEIVLQVSPLPVATIGIQTVTENAQRLLHGEQLALVDRVAGLLVLLYGQPLTRIVGLTVDRVGVDRVATTIRFGTEDVELVEPLGWLVRRLVAERRGHANLIVSDSPWLFPGGRPGVPMSSKHLGNRLRTIGIPSHATRSAVLIELGGELGPSVIADTLGLSIGAALRWVHAGGGNWNDYAANAKSSSR